MRKRENKKEKRASGDYDDVRAMETVFNNMEENREERITEEKIPIIIIIINDN